MTLFEKIALLLLAASYLLVSTGDYRATHEAPKMEKTND